MADIEAAEITLTVSFNPPVQEKVWRARRNIANCAQVTGSPESCPTCLERIAAIAALEAEGES